MSETAEPSPTVIDQSTDEAMTVPQKLSLLTGAAGALIALFAFLPAFSLVNYYSGTQYIQLFGTANGRVYPYLGGLIILLAMGRFFTAHMAFRIIAAVLGMATIALCAYDASVFWAQADTKTAGTGLTFHFTPVMLMIGLFGFAAIMYSCFSRRLYLTQKV